MGKCWRGRQQLEANCLTTFLRGAKELFGLRSRGIVVRVVRVVLAEKEGLGSNTGFSR